MDKYIRTDLFGFPFNGKFPPMSKSTNSLYHGYSSPAEECLFYDFAVLDYDLKFKYNGIYYYFMVDRDCVWLSDETFSAMIRKFDNGNDVLINLAIENKPLYRLVNELEDCEPM